MTVRRAGVYLTTNIFNSSYKLNHITQVQMAQKLSVSQPQIAAFKTGKVKIPISALPNLSVILSTPIDQILGIEKKAVEGQL